MTTMNLTMTTSFIKNIVDKNITEEVHNALVRYSLGEFVKEPFMVKVDKSGLTVKAGFEYLYFFQQFLASNLKGTIEICGVIESVRDLSEALKKLVQEFTVDKRFGKAGHKYVVATQRLSVETYHHLLKALWSDYVLLTASFPGGQLKLKSKTTPKLGSPTDNFCVLKLPTDLFSAFKLDYLFDVDVAFKNLTIEHTYLIDDITIDEKLLAQDALLARKKAVRHGQILRKITADGNVVKDYRIKFSA